MKEINQDNAMLLGKFLDKMVELGNLDSPGTRIEDNHKVCFYCGERLKWEDRQSSDDATAIIEHIYPKALGGTNHNHNLVWACRKCNTIKIAKHLLVWLRDCSLSIPDDITLEMIARIFWIYLRIVKEANDIPKQKNKLLAWARLVIETLDDSDGEEEKL